MNSKRIDVRINRFEKVENLVHFRIDFINILKIFIISFTAFYLIGNFVPFYEGDDASILGFASINLSEGKYDVTNNLLKETGSWDFVPRHWTKTIYNTMVPNIDIGFPTIGAIAYTLTGYYGLFYVVPILTTIFLITTDRIATNLFDRRVGLLALLFLASNFWILTFGANYMTDLPFSLIVIVGCFFFLKYLKKPTEKYLLLASILFTISAFVRINGIVLFLVEILIILSFFVYHVFLRNKYQEKTKNVSKNVGFTPLSINRSFKIVFSIIGPWSLFFLFLLSYNDYFFGDPLTMSLYVSESIDSKIYEQVIEESKKAGVPISPLLSEVEVVQEARSQGLTLSKDSSILKLSSDNFAGYFRAVLPFPLSHDIEFLERYDDLFGKYWIGFLTPILLAPIFLIAFKKNIKRMEITVFTVFLLSIILFYSTLSTAESQLERNISQRYSIPAFSLFSIMIGFLIVEIFYSGSSFSSLKHTKLLKLFKIIPVIFLLVFFLIAFFYAPLIQSILADDFKFNNPQDFVARYPIDTEGLTSKSIILDTQGYNTHEFGAIPLRSVRENLKPEQFDTNPVAQSLILSIKNLMNDNYDVYVFKDPSREVNKLYFRYLVEENDFILKEHSKTFCKFYLVENLNNTTKSDQVCV